MTTTLTRPAARRPRRLGGATRKAVLIVHIVAAGAWIGIDVVVAVLVGTAFVTDDPQTAALSYQALELFALWPMLSAGVLCLVSGVVLGLGSKYGLVRYWWVAVKLVLNVVLSTLVLVALRPGLYEAADYGRRLAEGLAVDPAAVQQLVYPPTVSLTALAFAVILSVAKPWGLVRKRAARASAAGTRPPTSAATGPAPEPR